MAFLDSDVKYRFYEIANSKCECCDKQLVFENRDYGEYGAWHAHHVIPKRVRIDDTIQNMAILCINYPNCHLKQGHGGRFQEAQPKEMWRCAK